MKKLLIGTLCVAAAVQFANAEEFGAAAATADVSGPAIAADQAAMEMPSLKTSDKSAWEELSDYIADPKNSLVVDRKDSANNRFVVKEKISFTIRSQDVGKRYLELREGMMSLLLLKAKVKLARLRSGRIEPKKLSVDDDESTTLTRELKRLAGMEFVGTTVLEQFESCQKDGNMFKCEIAILMSWSKESEAVAKGVKLAFENPKQAPVLLKPGKNTIDGWANKKRKDGALGEWLGPRRYVDKDGVVWFIGIAASPCEKNERRNDKKIEEARMLAEAEVAWALYGDVKMTNVLKKTMKTLDQKELDDISDDEKSEFGTKFARMMSDESALETAGMIYPFEGVVKDASGQKINVVVAGISVQSKREALKDLRESEDTAREVKAGDASERRAREAKVGMPKKADGVTATTSGAGRSDAKSAEPEKKGRLGTGVRHYSDDD
jgi:hypothetical protein